MSTGSAAVSTTCLELSQEDGAAHKFYEVSVADLVVTVRYGRIGAAGQRRRVLPGAR
jgi:predicted DNA-binding WGR domain protein